MAEFGVTAQGFVVKDLQTIIGEMEDDQRSGISASLNTEADSLVGNLNGVYGDKVAELWEVGAAIYRARQPGTSSGEALDNVADITGALRLAAEESDASLSLNLDPGVTVTVGSIVSIGAIGAQWETLVEVTNGGAVQATFDVSAESADDAPIVGNAGTIDTIVTPIAGWSAKAAFTSLTSQPFPLVDKQTLLFQVDEGETQTVIFVTGDFADISNATAQEIIDAITANTTGISGLDVAGFVRLFSDLDGSGSAIRVVGGTGFEALGLSRELIKGFNPSRAAKIVNGTNETYDLSGSPSLFVAIDEGLSQPIQFVDADFGVASFGDIVAIAANLLAAGVDTDTFVLDDGLNPAVTFAFDDDSSVAETDTLRAINHTGAETANQMRDAIVAAINAAPTLGITASPNPFTGTIVELVNDLTGVAGNIAIAETVADAGFVVTGMAGGVADTPAIATALQVARKITAVLIGGVAYVVAGKVQIESLVTGNNSLVEVTGGSANTELGYVLSTPENGVPGDAILGRDVQDDPDFRVRRDQLLRLPGAAAFEVVRANVRSVDKVTQAFVFENTTAVVDAFGRPPKSMEIVVVGGSDQDIADTIFRTRPLGIETHKVAGPNGVTVAIIDSQGNSHDMNFSRQDDIDFHVEIDVEVVKALFGAGSQVNGEQEIREAIKKFGDNLQLGQDIIILKFKCIPLDIVGVEDVTGIFIEDVDPPLNTSNIAVGPRDQAKFAIANIDINVTFV